MKAIDLFSGFGGSSTGASMAGIDVVWAGNHWQEAVGIHALNHPSSQHVCQDLHQADWSSVPAHDLLIASPCCQGHSKARGKKSGKRRASTTRHKEYIKAQDEAENRYRSRIDELMNDKYQLEMKCREQVRDILAYRRLVQGETE